jgi:hypothetical protein
MRRFITGSLLYTIYYYGDKTEEDEMGGASRAHKKVEKCIQNFIRESWMDG